MKSGFKLRFHDSESHCFPLHHAVFIDVQVSWGSQISVPAGYMKSSFSLMKSAFGPSRGFLYLDSQVIRTTEIIYLFVFLFTIPHFSFLHNLLTQKARPARRIPHSSLGEHVSGWKSNSPGLSLPGLSYSTGTLHLRLSVGVRRLLLSFSC